MSRIRIITAVLAGVVLVGCSTDRRPSEPASAASATGPLSRYEFADVTEEAGIAHPATRAWGGAWQDFDDDGDPDLFVNRHTARPLLLVNSGGSYSPVEMNWASQMDRHACAWGEANGDGRPDLYCTRGAQRGHGRGPNQMLVQTDDGFDDRASSYGIANKFGRGRTVNWLDYDSDGDLDLFVGNKIREHFGNVVFRNDSNGFTRVDVGLSDELSTVSSSWADWDLDGDPDMLLLQYLPHRSLAYENVDGSFRPVALPGITGRPWLAGAWGDYDGDGWSDLHLISEDRSVVFHNSLGELDVEHAMPLRDGRMSTWIDADNDMDLDLFVVQGAHSAFPSPDSPNHPDFMLIRRKGGFSPVREPSLRGPDTGDGDSVVSADHNRDGEIDLFVTNGYRHWRGTYALLENRSRTGNWVGADLVGDLQNPMGIGARVHVTTSAGAYWRQVTDGFSFRAQSEIGYLHLGIGESESARIRVIWADDSEDCMETSHNSIRRVEKGTAPCP